MNILLNFITTLFGARPSRAEVITASISTAVDALAQHAAAAQAKADDHGAEIQELAAKQAALVAEAAQVAQVAANIGALLK